MERINFYEAFGFGWQVVTKHWYFLAKVWIMGAIISFLINYVDSFWYLHSHFLSGSERFLYVVFKFLVWFILIVVAYNNTRINLGIFHGQKQRVTNLFKLPTERTIRYVVAFLMYCFMVTLGFICLIIPGIYFAIKYFYVTTIVADKGIPVLDAAELSAKLTHGEKWSMFAYLLIMFICCAAMVIVGFFCLFLGVIPAAMIAYWIFTYANLHVYKKLH